MKLAFLSLFLAVSLLSAQSIGLPDPLSEIPAPPTPPDPQPTSGGSSGSGGSGGGSGGAVFPTPRPAQDDSTQSNPVQNITQEETESEEMVADSLESETVQTTTTQTQENKEAQTGLVKTEQPEQVQMTQSEEFPSELILAGAGVLIIGAIIVFWVGVRGKTPKA